MIPLTTVPFMSSLYDLLTDKELSHDSGKLLFGDSPHIGPSLDRDFFDDFDTGSRFTEAYKHLKEGIIDLPLGIVEFVDKTHQDVNGRLTQEPVAFTIALYKRILRYKAVAWKSFGNIPSFQNLSYKDTRKKYFDYHHLLNLVHADLYSIQTTKAGILWPLLYKGQYHMVRFRPYILCVLGDTPGQNVLCGKYNGNKHNNLCRYCNISKDDLSNPRARSSRITKSILQYTN